MCKMLIFRGVSSRKLFPSNHQLVNGSDGFIYLKSPSLTSKRSPVDLEKLSSNKKFSSKLAFQHKDSLVGWNSCGGSHLWHESGDSLGSSWQRKLGNVILLVASTKPKSGDQRHQLRFGEVETNHYPPVN